MVQRVRRARVLLMAGLVLAAGGLAGCLAPDAPGANDDPVAPGNASTPPDDAPACAEDACEPGDPDPDAEGRGNTTDPKGNATTPATPPEDPATTPMTGREPVVTVAVIDTGINPYHREFRDPSPLAEAHPSTYIPGYPEDAKALPLSLDAPDLETALQRDKALWENVDPNALYWVPGTRIVGLRTFALDGEIPGFDEHGHGTMSASRAAGFTTSLAPAARIVALEGLSTEAVAWAAGEPWIDVQTNSWVTLAPSPWTRATFADAAAAMPVFAAAGNGLAQIAGGAGQPSTAGATQGAAGVIAVGGHDNGKVTLWTGTVPHVVADACYNWAADAESMDRTAPDIGTGTSSATPYAAGAAASLILNAKRVLGDVTGTREGGVLARAAGDATLPAEGPLADGDFTLDELKRVLYATAIPRPDATKHDGDVCGLGMTPYATTPVDYGAIPEDAPLYYFVGYGAINEHSIAHAVRVLGGADAVPERPVEDTFFGTDAWLRALATP